MGDKPRILMLMTNAGFSLSQGFKRLISLIVSSLIVLSHSTAVIAQARPDVEAPQLDIEIVQTAVADLSQVFTVQASDDVAIGDVSLHHRRTGQSVFKRSVMEPIGDTGFFSIAIDTDPTDLRSFEYYAQVLDLNGNRTVKGFAFDPFVREITAAPASTLAGAPQPDTTDEQNDAAVAVVAAPTSTTITKPSSSVMNWVYIGLGILAAGALASQIGGDSSGGGGSSGDDPLVPLTVIVGDPIQ